MRLERQQLDEVDERKGGEDEIGAPGPRLVFLEHKVASPACQPDAPDAPRELVFLKHKVPQREREPGERKQEEWAETFPQAIQEGDRRRMVVLESEPAGAGEALHTRDVIPGRSSR